VLETLAIRTNLALHVLEAQLS